ncbi:hypothetical protein HYT45_01645 [Candidatus Uhrbacteria bacterium]|nr:hypothetical protein [Candidatus Uhrbacteria bacterium]
MNNTDVLAFARDLENNIFSLHEILLNKTYYHGSYEHFFVNDPKRRYISKAIVRDRVAHQAVVQIIEPIFEPQFIFDSYSSRKDKGTHAAVLRLEKFFRQATANYHFVVYALKCDIRKFFDSVRQDILLDIIRRKISDENIIWLIKEILQSYCANEKPGCGLPLGNATSQLFANIYLNGLDHFVKEKLGMRWYVRFCDDFIILHRSPAVLEDTLFQIRRYLLEERGLELHPKKVSIRKLSYGIDFVGQAFRPHYRTLRLKTKKRIFCVMRRHIESYQNGEISDESFRQSAQSYFGLLKYGDNYCLGRRLRETIWRQIADKLKSARVNGI